MNWLPAAFDTNTLQISKKKPPCWGCAAALLTVLFQPFLAQGAINPNEWKFQQTLDVPAHALFQVNLPVEALNAARPDLADLRILDPAGGEVPYLIDKPRPSSESTVAPAEFRTEVSSSRTQIFLTTGTKASLNGVVVTVPAGNDFIKAVRIEGSHDGSQWRLLTEGQPIFRTRAGASKLRILFPVGPWEFLRLTVDDTRTPQVPFTGAELITSASKAPVEALPIHIQSRDDGPGATRLVLDLGESNLTVATLSLATADPLFTRQVTVSVPELEGDKIVEKPIHNSVIYRLELNGKTESQLEIPVEEQIRGRELLVLIANGDSPPLPIQSVTAERRLTRIYFFAREPGQYLCLYGNSDCSAPEYDLSGISTQVKSATAVELHPSAVKENPDYKAPDQLAALSLTGAPIDLKGWKFRRRIELAKAGAQEVELEPGILARAASNLRDVRVVREQRQLPFLIERTSISRVLPLAANMVNGAKRPTISRWSLKLPEAGVPITQITCTSSSALFQREMRLWEEVTDERGETYPRELGQASWRHVPAEGTSKFVITLKWPPSTDTLFLETDNGDNSPIELGNFRGYYPVTRLIFDIPPGAAKPVWIYYGNPDAVSPNYDVNLVADRILRAERHSVTLGAPEKLESKGERVERTLSGWRLYIFWGVLAVVVAGLLILISRLLPKSA
jgi:Protein of unknown function (DUF3999)